MPLFFFFLAKLQAKSFFNANLYVYLTWFVSCMQFGDLDFYYFGYYYHLIIILFLTKTFRFALEIVESRLQSLPAPTGPSLAGASLNRYHHWTESLPIHTNHCCSDIKY